MIDAYSYVHRARQLSVNRSAHVFLLFDVSVDFVGQECVELVVRVVRSVVVQVTPG